MGIAYGTTTLHQATKGIVQDGLVLNLDAAVDASYNGGTTWRDLAGSNNGTLTNGPTFSSENGGVLSFDGTDDYAYVLGNTGELLNLTIYTVELLIKATYSGGTVILEKGVNAKMLIQPYSGSRPRNIFYGDYSTFIDTSDILTGDWLNFSFTQSSTSRSLYFNGVLKHTDSSGGNGIANSSNIVLMGRATSYNQAGNISSFRVYNRVLSANEVAQNYNATRHRFGV